MWTDKSRSTAKFQKHTTTKSSWKKLSGFIKILNSASPSVEVRELQSSRLALGFPRAHSLCPTVSDLGSFINTLTDFSGSKGDDLSSAMSKTQFSSYSTQLMSPNVGITVKLQHNHGQGNDSFINFDLIRRGKLKHYMR